MHEPTLLKVSLNAISRNKNLILRWMIHVAILTLQIESMTLTLPAECAPIAIADVCHQDYYHAALHAQLASACV